MPIAWEDVANMAVGRLGISSQVTSLSSNDKLSVACNTFIFNCRDQVLQSWDWKCASVRAALTVDATAPVFGFKYRYLLPATPFCLMVREVRPRFIDYVIEGRYLLCDFPGINHPLYIRYTSSIDDPSIIDPLLIKAIAWNLAAQICNQFVQGNGATGQAAILKEAYAFLEEAQGINQYNDKNHDEDADYMEDASFRGHGEERGLRFLGDNWVRGGTNTATY